MAKKRSKFGPTPIDPSGPVQKVTISLAPSMLERVDRLAQINGQGRTYIVRRALEEWLPDAEHMARSLSDPFFGGLRRRLLKLAVQAESSPDRARELAEIIERFEQSAPAPRVRTGGSDAAPA